MGGPCARRRVREGMAARRALAGPSGRIVTHFVRRTLYDCVRRVRLSGACRRREGGRDASGDRRVARRRGHARLARRARLRGRLRAGRRAGEAGGRAGRLHRSRPLSASARRARAHQPGAAGVGDRRRAQEGPRRRDARASLENNHRFHRLLVDGIDVEYTRPDGSIAGDKAWLVDFDDPEANDWLAINQFTVVEGKTNRRPDVVVFVNGLPLAVIELKNPARRQGHDQDRPSTSCRPTSSRSRACSPATSCSSRATASRRATAR